MSEFLPYGRQSVDDDDEAVAGVQKGPHMPITWKRTHPFTPSAERTEVWTCTSDSGEREHLVHVTLGKPVDIVSLKSDLLRRFGDTVRRIRESRKCFLAAATDLVCECPVCGTITPDTPEPVANIYGARYVQCPSCTHCFVQLRPSRKALEDFYANDRDYQATYANRSSTGIRLEQVARPKAAWALRRFGSVLGATPARVLDVGAGSGHFVKACRDLGLDADGIEPSRLGRDFCSEEFGIDLFDGDFAEDYSLFAGYDLVTFWGVIEHVPNPMEMLGAAVQLLAGHDGMICVEVPRWDCFGTAVQLVFSDSVVRHLDPLGHVHCFTDSSLATAFEMSDLEISAAWYFGMDFYELTTQLAHATGEGAVLEELASRIPFFQSVLDMSLLSDEMVLAGVSRRE